MRDCEPGLDFEVARGGIEDEMRPESEADRVARWRRQQIRGLLPAVSPDPMIPHHSRRKGMIS